MSRGTPLIVGRGEFGFPADLHPREGGLLVLVRPNGSELRLHQAGPDRWELLEWREATGHDGSRRWIGPSLGWLSAGDWIACGRAMAEREASQSTGAALNPVDRISRVD